MGDRRMQLINKLVTALMLFFGAQARHGRQLTIGELVAFNMLAGRVSTPVLRLAQIWQDFHQTRISVDRLGDILNTPPEPLFAPGRTALPAVRGDITFEHVTFRYASTARKSCSDVSFTIPAGQVVGIVGPSGSGKSTLAKLVQRLYVPESGRVLVDGVDLALVDPAWLRRQIGVVLQENDLFNRTIRDNIALANPAHAHRTRSSPRRNLPARTISFWSCPRATTRMSASAAPAFPAASASASLSHGRSCRTRAS